MAQISNDNTVMTKKIFYCPLPSDQQQKLSLQSLFFVTTLVSYGTRKCQAISNKTMSPARSWTRTTRSRVKRTNHEATAPPQYQTRSYNFLYINKLHKQTLSTVLSIWNMSRYYVMRDRAHAHRNWLYDLWTHRGIAFRTRYFDRIDSYFFLTVCGNLLVIAYHWECLARFYVVIFCPDTNMYYQIMSKLS